MRVRFEKKRIKELRLNEGLSQSEFARRLETSRQKIANWEVGECNPQIASILKLCEVFNVNPDYFFVAKNVCIHTEDRGE